MQSMRPLPNNGTIYCRLYHGLGMCNNLSVDVKFHEVAPVTICTHYFISCNVSLNNCAISGDGYSLITGGRFVCLVSSNII